MCAEKIILWHVSCTRFFLNFIQSEPIEIHWFNVHFFQVVWFLAFGLLLDPDFFASDSVLLMLIWSALLIFLLSLSRPGVSSYAQGIVWSGCSLMFADGGWCLVDSRYICRYLLGYSQSVEKLNHSVDWCNSPYKTPLKFLSPRQRQTEPEWRNSILNY